MNRPEHNNTNFFFGREIEHTPVYNKYTLFVIGVQPIEEIATKLTSGEFPVDHIYFGANMSFPKCGVNDIGVWRSWEQMILPFLEKDLWCSLDIDSTCVEGLCEGALSEYRNFIPMISVKLPYARLLGYNAIIKIDDKDFDATNPGVWCHSLHTLMDRNKFTSWSEYNNDKVI
jgi:hypothetical protein